MQHSVCDAAHAGEVRGALLPTARRFALPSCCKALGTSIWSLRGRCDAARRLELPLVSTIVDEVHKLLSLLNVSDVGLAATHAAMLKLCLQQTAAVRCSAVLHCVCVRCKLCT